MTATRRPDLPSRDATRSRVFEVLSRNLPVSRPELAETTGLSRATIAVVVDDMIRQGIVRGIGSGNSRGGRPPIILQLDPGAAYAIGASLYDYEWRIVATDLTARVIQRERAVLSDSGPSAAIQSLSDGIARLRSRLDPSRMLQAIGIGSPGLVDIRSARVISATDLGWKEVPIGSIITESTGIPTLVANRSKAAALAAFWHIAQRKTTNLIFITIGTGVSAGIVQEGQLFLGANSSAGELGHVTIVPDGPFCECGNRGCLQELISERAIAAAARIILRTDAGGQLAQQCGNHPEMLTAFDVLTAAEDGDPSAVSVVEQTAGYLSIAVGNLINLFNPEVIILGGPVAEHSPLLVSRVSELVRHRAMAYPLSVVSIRKNELGPETGAIGASVLVLEHAHRLIFDLPSPGHVHQEPSRR